MASCPKCGKPRLRKDSENRRYCPHCGILRSQANMDRSGVIVSAEQGEAAESA